MTDFLRPGGEHRHSPPGTAANPVDWRVALPIADLLPEYERWLVAKGHRPRGIERYMWNIRATCRDLGERATLADLSVPRLRLYQEALAARCTPAVVANMLTTVRSFCKWAIRHGHMTADPTTQLDWPKKPKRSPRALNRRDLHRLFDILHPPNEAVLTVRQQRILHRNRRAIFLMLFAGLRISEVTNLRWCDVDLEARSLVVRDAKGGKTRSLPIHTTLLAELAHVAVPAPTDPVICTDTGEPITPKGLAHIFERWIAKQGLAMTAHQLRHSFATELLRSGVSLPEIQALLGHESIETTQVYLTIESTHLHGAVNKLPEAW